MCFSSWLIFLDSLFSVCFILFRSGYTSLYLMKFSNLVESFVIFFHVVFRHIQNTGHVIKLLKTFVDLNFILKMSFNSDLLSCDKHEFPNQVPLDLKLFTSVS